MTKQENLNNPEDSSKETPEQKEMSEQLKKMAEDLEKNNLPPQEEKLTEEENKEDLDEEKTYKILEEIPGLLRTLEINTGISYPRPERPLSDEQVIGFMAKDKRIKDAVNYFLKQMNHDDNEAADSYERLLGENLENNDLPSQEEPEQNNEKEITDQEELTIEQQEENIVEKWAGEIARVSSEKFSVGMEEYGYSAFVVKDVEDALKKGYKMSEGMIKSKATEKLREFETKMEALVEKEQALRKGLKEELLALHAKEKIKNQN